MIVFSLGRPMLAAFLPVALISVFCSGVILGGNQEEDAMKVINRIADLERQLNSDDLAERDAAEKELLQLGPVALDYLPVVSPDMTTDVQMRLARVRTGLERIAVEQVSEPSIVRLEGKMPVSEILAALTRQTGNELVISDRASIALADVSIDTGWDNEEFWDVIAQLESRAGISVDPYGGKPGQLAFTDQAGASQGKLASAGVSGTVSFGVARIDAARNFLAPAADNMFLELKLKWEPRLRPIRLELPMESIELVDSAGNTVPISEKNRVVGATIQPMLPETEMSIPLPLLDRKIESIQSLKGNLRMTVPGRIESFEFPEMSKLLPDSRQSKAGATVTYHGISDNLDLKSIKMSLQFDEPNGGMESYLGWAAENEVFLRCKDGSRIDPIGLETWQQAEFLLGVSYFFPEAPDDAVLVYRTPAAIVLLNLPIELKGIPLP